MLPNNSKSSNVCTFTITGASASALPLVGQENDSESVDCYRTRVQCHLQQLLSVYQQMKCEIKVQHIKETQPHRVFILGREMYPYRKTFREAQGGE